MKLVDVLFDIVVLFFIYYVLSTNNILGIKFIYSFIFLFFIIILAMNLIRNYTEDDNLKNLLYIYNLPITHKIIIILNISAQVIIFIMFKQYLAALLVVTSQYLVLNLNDYIKERIKKIEKEK